MVPSGPDETRVIGLTEGRELAWIELGDPAGPAVFAFHGSPGRGSIFAPHHNELVAAGLRVIAPDRPGYGHSTFLPGRTYASWADDVALLADRLRVERFAVFGVSSGGPNAAVCARFLGDRLTGCAIVSSPAPFDPAIPDAGMKRANRTGRRIVRVAPRFTAWSATMLFRLSQNRPERAYEFAVRDLPATDLAIVRRADVRAAMLSDLARPQSPTTARTAVQDFTLEVNDWGFRLADIALPVQVWHGDDDRNLPVLNGIRIADAIPDATLHRVPNAGHWLYYERLTEILRGIVAS
jgi:pimeloyl-ACP methyl ester carboxylesterase